MEIDLPFKAEYSKSSRASCKGCKNKIDAEVVRIAVMVQVRKSVFRFSFFVNLHPLTMYVKRMDDQNHLDTRFYPDIFCLISHSVTQILFFFFGRSRLLVLY